MVTINELIAHKNALIKNKIPFEIHYNNMSCKIIGGLGPTLYAIKETKDSHDKKGDIKFSLYYMHFVNKVLCHVERKIKNNKLIIKDYHSTKIDYFDVGLKKYGTYKNCVELDIDSAYWETAYKLNVISRDIYREGLKLPKKVRLMALGILAKKTTVYKFDGKEMKRMPVIENKKTKYFWNQICKHVADVMITISAGINEGSYLFYWVDAVFIKKESLKETQEIITGCGYKYKLKTIDKVVYKKGLIKVDGRDFSIPTKKEYLSDLDYEK
jgi:hypothetical protein